MNQRAGAASACTSSAHARGGDAALAKPITAIEPTKAAEAATHRRSRSRSELSRIDDTTPATGHGIRAHVKLEVAIEHSLSSLRHSRRGRRTHPPTQFELSKATAHKS
jgi:hypothetical protein